MTNFLFLLFSISNWISKIELIFNFLNKMKNQNDTFSALWSKRDIVHVYATFFVKWNLKLLFFIVQFKFKNLSPEWFSVYEVKC